MISSIVLFFSLAAWGVGPVVDAPRLGVVPFVAGLSAAAVVDAANVAAGVSEEAAGLFKLPNSPPDGAAVEVAVDAVVLAAGVDDDPNALNSPPDGAAEVVEVAAFAGAELAAPNNPPLNADEAGLFRFANIPPDGAGVVLVAAGAVLLGLLKRLEGAVVAMVGAAVEVEVDD